MSTVEVASTLGPDGRLTDAEQQAGVLVPAAHLSILTAATQGAEMVPAAAVQARLQPAKADCYRLWHTLGLAPIQIALLKNLALGTCESYLEASIAAGYPYRFESLGIDSALVQRCGEELLAGKASLTEIRQRLEEASGTVQVSMSHLVLIRAHLRRVTPQDVLNG